jgi:predicted kinase
VPLLVVVTGHPATGKTWLAGELGAALGLPVFHKDVVKELLADALGWSDRASSQRLGHAATLVLYDTVERLLGAGRSLVVESNFPAEHSSVPLRSSVESHGARVVQLVLRCRPDVMAARFAARERHPVHVLRELGPLPDYEPLDLPGPLLEVETTRLPLDVDPIVEFVNQG